MSDGAFDAGRTGGLLRLSQWLSPAFPVSAYAYSHGLEAEICHGRVRDGADVAAWIEGVVRRGAGRTDAIVMLSAMQAGADLDRLHDLARALAGSRERWEETRDQGAALAATLAAMGEGDGVARAYPVALGAAAARLDLAADVVAALYLQSVVGNLVSAAVRFVPLGQAEGQRIVAGMQGAVADVAAEVVNCSIDDIAQAAFGADLAAMEHEGLEVRIFRT
ncbi:urease accessory protein UreF [Jannaschia sp. CCS1]|uniref:Urease accessory protein UreF n=1 Tax=Jannaschia sp. (strain CCS1) TaxID=290400 RepID=UREF_JANSC|nr:urease accessory UreF family protein [Jannaschia sp. CCS1]Q28RJ0.1 RecName: Full=Urease accessory protein UreF [Jannaschia sp. CCS1]ABD54672.1 Urease accessory protein UreF [Jannaschia sp. CCS1]